MSIRDQGFGLNFNQGFGSHFVATPGAGAGSQAGQNSAWDNYMQRQQNDAANKRAGDQNALQRYMSDAGNASAQQISAGDNSSRERIAGQDAATRQAGYASAERQAQIAAQASEYPAQLQQERFKTVLPYFTQALQGLQGQGAYGYRGNGQVGSQPQIDAKPVFSQGDVQQQVNSQRSQADARAQSDIRGQRAGMAGRGFGANSPLAQALESASLGRAMTSGATSERETRLGSAQANSDAMLKGQTAQEQQFANRQSEDIERNKAYQGALASMLGAFGNIL